MLSCLLLASCSGKRKVVTASTAVSRPVPEVEPVVSKRDTVSTLPPHLTLTPVQQRRLVEEAMTWLGTPYRLGEHSKECTDCSGFIMEVYRATLDIDMPRTTAEQSRYFTPIQRSHLSPGDVLFFSSKASRDKVAHVGMYIGDNNMIHASSSRGVMVSNIDEAYFATHYRGGGRLPGNPVEPVESVDSAVPTVPVAPATSVASASPVAPATSVASATPVAPDTLTNEPKKERTLAPDAVVRNAFRRQLEAEVSAAVDSIFRENK